MVLGISMLVLSLGTQQPAQWRLVEEWRVGGEVEGPHSFGDVRGMGLLANGGIVLLDFKDQQLHFLDAQGGPVRSVGRTGGGPGEFQQANGLVVTPKGEVLVSDPGNARFTLLSAQGDLIRTVPVQIRSYGFRWDASFDDQSRLNESVMIHQPGEQRTVVARQVWNADFTRADTLRPASCPEGSAPKQEDVTYSFGNRTGMMMMSIPFVSPQTSVIQDSDGARWRGNPPGYDVLARIPQGQCDPQISIRLRGARVPVPEPVRDSAVAQVRKNAARFGAPDPDLSKIPREYLPFEALYLDSRKQLWVERRIDARSRQFEVYRTTGDQLAVVTSPVVFQSYRPLIITNEQVLGFVTDQDELLYLTSFRIIRGN